MTTDEIRVEEAASLLVAARLNCEPLNVLPDDARPRTLEEAYAIQDAVLRHLKNSGAGWKVGAKSYAHPSTCAPLLEGSIRSGATDLSNEGLRLFGIEAEIAFRFDVDTPRQAVPYSREDIMQRVTAYPAVEVLESRFADILAIDRLSAVADNITNGFLILGEAIANWRERDLQHPFVKFTRNAKMLAIGVGNNGGDPYRLLMDLVLHATQRRGLIRAGEVVTTGTLTGIMFGERGDIIAADFGRLGRVEVTF